MPFIKGKKDAHLTVSDRHFHSRLDFKMENRMTFKQYRNMDIMIFAVLTAIFEAVATFATSKWFSGQPVAISITLTLILITMHRWGIYAAAVAVAGGVAFCFASGASVEHYLIYALGNAFALVSLAYFKLFGKEALKGSFLKTLLFASTSYVAVALGRWLISLIFGAGVGELVGFLTTDVISLLFAVAILYSCRGVDGLVEDQKKYVIRVNEKKEEDLPLYDE